MAYGFDKPAEIHPTGINSVTQALKSLCPTDRPRRHGAKPLFLPRKEVIQPQLPLQLPCYDFVPVTNPTLGHCLPKVGPWTSGVASFHDVTGGVYKARERIHRSMLTCGY